MGLFQNIFTKKQYIIIIALMILLIIASGIILVNKPQQPYQSPPVIIFNPSPTAKVSQSNVYPDLISIVGVTTDENLKRRPDLKRISILPDGKTQYSFISKLNARDNIVITRNGITVFERFIKMEDNLEKYSLDYYKRVYGNPEKEIVGSKFYGIAYTTYIFAGKGIALIGDTKSEDIVEIQIFIPTSTNTYLQQWGEDIQPYEGEAPGP
ncbi:hypothetical protein HYU95_01435 [Candidatus Daviesbacteria bacterium]|nr:hypothetical protein [Candidatus Daviesbacteria bacterium]